MDLREIRSSRTSVGSHGVRSRVCMSTTNVNLVRVNTSCKVYINEAVVATSLGVDSRTTDNRIEKRRVPSIRPNSR